jgi:hypothetical protein
VSLDPQGREPWALFSFESMLLSHPQLLISAGIIRPERRFTVRMSDCLLCFFANPGYRFSNLVVRFRTPLFDLRDRSVADWP